MAKPKMDMEALANQQEVDPAKVAAAINLARELWKLETEIEQLLIEMKAKTERLAVLQTSLLPEAMQAAGMSEYSLGNSGYSIVVEDFVRASIPSQTSIDKADGPEREALVNRKQEALNWLRTNNADSLIKNKLTAEFGKGQDKAAKKFAERIEKAGYPAKCEESVHPQTLNKFIKEQLEVGKAVPTETFALFVGKQAQITKQKGK